MYQIINFSVGRKAFVVDCGLFIMLVLEGLVIIFVLYEESCILAVTKKKCDRLMYVYILSFFGILLYFVFVCCRHLRVAYAGGSRGTAKVVADFYTTVLDY